MEETTAVDTTVVCAFCGKPRSSCDCPCTVRSSFEIIFASEEKKR